MGACWNTPIPPETDYIKRRLRNYGIQPSLHKPSSKGHGAGFGREESQLQELLSALRTGLLFSPTQFSVLPGMATTGRVTFSLGNTELHKLTQYNDEDEDSESDELPEAVVLNDDDQESEGVEGTECLQERYPLQITLKGRTWFDSLTMKLVVRPSLGPFSGKKVVFLWSAGTLRVAGYDGPQDTHSLPVEFEDETQFCSCCLLLLYQATVATEGEEEGIHAEKFNGKVAPLQEQAYKRAMCNLDLVKDLYSIPPKLYYNLFGSRPPVIVAVKLWPRHPSNQSNANTTMRVKSHILFAEFIYLVREHFGISSEHTLKLYHKSQQVTATQLVTDQHRLLDCFVISPLQSSCEEEEGSCTSLNDDSYDNTVTLVLSVVGRNMISIDADQDMTMKDFDSLLRNELSLQSNSFLVIVSEDDFSPQYTSDDNWKCTYPFNVPNTSISAGLRRSFRRLAEKRAGASRLTQSQRFQRSEAEGSSLSPHMSSVVKLLSSQQRQFPGNNDRYSLDLKELYSSMPLYQRSLSQCGLHPYSIVQVFEVTGPAIPLTVRQLSDHKQQQQQQEETRQQTCLANIMDINPKWSLNTFLQYVDTIISPGTSYRRTRLSLSHHRLDEFSTESEWAVSLGELLGEWSPAWWGEGDLTSRDIDPAQFLLIERY